MHTVIHVNIFFLILETMPDTQALMPVGAVQPGPPGGTIPLSTLIDYIIQSTYHELVVLSELWVSFLWIKSEEITCTKIWELFLQFWCSIMVEKWLHICNQKEEPLHDSFTLFILFVFT